MKKTTDAEREQNRATQDFVMTLVKRHGFVQMIQHLSAIADEWARSDDPPRHIRDEHAPRPNLVAQLRWRRVAAALDVAREIAQS